MHRGPKLITSQAFTVLSLAPKSFGEKQIHITVGKQDKERSHELDLALKHLSESGIRIRKTIGDKSSAIWRLEHLSSVGLV
jgi:hypothetical protein